jgi:hypothetical protein
MAEADTELEIAIVRCLAFAVQRVGSFLRHDATHLREGSLEPRVLARSHVVAGSDALADSKVTIAIAAHTVDLGAEQIAGNL